MSNAENWIRNLLSADEESPTEDEMVSIITGQAAIAEQVRIIQLIMQSEVLVEEFGEIWDELLPQCAGSSPQETLRHLLRLTSIRQKSPRDLATGVSDPSTPEWVVEYVAVHGRIL